MLTIWLLLALTALIALSVAIDLVLWVRHLLEAQPRLPTRRNAQP